MGLERVTRLPRPFPLTGKDGHNLPSRKREGLGEGLFNHPPKLSNLLEYPNNFSLWWPSHLAIDGCQHRHKIDQRR